MQINVVQPKPEMRGKGIKFTCSNASCSQVIRLTIPKLPAKEVKSTVFNLGPIKEIQSAALILQANEYHSEQTFSIESGHYVVGRKSKSKYPDLSLDTTDHNISRLHCIIEGKIDKLGILHFILRDHQSKNGVLLNGNSLLNGEEVYLQDNDVIQIGKSKMLFLPQYKSK